MKIGDIIDIYMPSTQSTIKAYVLDMTLHDVVSCGETSLDIYSLLLYSHNCLFNALYEYKVDITTEGDKDIKSYINFTDFIVDFCTFPNLEKQYPKLIE